MNMKFLSLIVQKYVQAMLSWSKRQTVKKKIDAPEFCSDP